MRNKISQREARELRKRVSDLEQQLRLAKTRVHLLSGSVSLGRLTIPDSAAWLSGRIEGASMCGRTVVVKHLGYPAGQSAQIEFHAVDPKVTS